MLLFLTKKIGNFDDTIRSILAFAFTTIATIGDFTDRAILYFLHSNTGLVCCSIAFAHDSFDKFIETIPFVPVAPSFLKFLQNSFTLALLLPSKPRVDPFELFRLILKSAQGLKWPDDEFLWLRLDCIGIVAHSLRTEFVVKIDGIDSNNILFGGNEEFKERGLKFVGELIDNFLVDLNQYKSKGIMAAKTKIPAIVLRVLIVFVDSFEIDLKLLKIMSKFADLIGESTTLNDLKKTTAAHLKRVFGENEIGLKFLNQYFKAF